MAISKNTQANIDDSNPAAYPNGQVKDDDGTGNGFPLIQVTMSDIYETFDKLMRLAGLTFNATFDNETNGYQFVQGLIALASKSDYILPLTTSTGILQIPTALQILQTNEKLICKAGADFTTETQIKGTAATLYTLSTTSSYKTGDYVMLIRTSGGVQLIRLVTADNINLVVSENAYLKAASNDETITGALTTKAVTPASFLDSFTKLVTIAGTAAPYYATDSTPGLLSAPDKAALDGFSSPVKNVGWFSGVDVGGGTIGALAPVNGDITVAQITAVGGSGDFTTYRVTMANAMSNVSKYFVRFHIQSEGTFTPTDISVGSPEFRPVSTTQFDFSIIQFGLGGVQNLKIHCEVVQFP